MTKFTYQATDRVGETVKGEMEASTKEVVFDALTKKRLTPILIKRAEAKSAKKKGLSLQMSIGGISTLDKILFVKRLSAVLKAGIPVVESLDILTRDSKKGKLKDILIELKASLERGETLAAGFGKFENEFSPVFVGLIKSGENSGTLGESLDTLASYLRREYDVKQNVRSAMFYPVLLLFSSVAIIVVLVGFVLPRITTTFVQAGVELPFITRFLIGISSTVRANIPLTILGVIFFIAFMLFLLLSSRGKLIMSGIIMRLPVFKTVIRQTALARFARIFSSLLKSGVPAIEALDIVSHAIGNKSYERQIIKAMKNVKRGVSLADSLREREDLFPNVIISMIAIGEKTGTLDETLGSLADFYDEEVDRLIKNALTMIEPIMLLVMGVMIGGIAVAILIPIYQLVSGIA